MSISSPGIGSGLDVATLVQQLVASERAPTAARIDRVERRTKAEISAIGSLRSTLDSLRTTVGKLRSNDAAQSRKVTLQAEAGFRATARSGAATGTYNVEILSVAGAHKLASSAYTTAQTAVGTGRLTITSGETTLDIDIDAGNNTLEGIRDAINQSAQGKGVAATIVQADDGAHLVLNAMETGVSNALRVTTSGGDGGLDALRYDPPTSSNLQQLNAASDARVKVDEFERSSSTNTIADMVEGVTLTLTDAAPGTIKQLTISSDPSVLRNAAKGFVAAYNAALGAIAATTKYDPATQTAAALNGDALVRGVSRDLREQLGDAVVDLKAIGITIDKDGMLKLDEAAFDAAIAQDPAPAARLFAADDGLAAGLETSLKRLLDDDGLLDSRSDDLTRRTDAIADQRAALDLRMSQVEARYRAQFVALDGLMARLQSTSSFLVQQLDLP